MANLLPSALILGKLLLLHLSTAEIFIPKPSTYKAVLPPISGKLSVTYNGVVNQNLQQTYLYQVEPLYWKVLATNLRLKVGTNATSENSVFVTILQPNEDPASFRLQPFAGQIGKISTTDTYYVEQTICTLNADYYEKLPISVVLSTQSREDVPYSLVISISQDFLLELDVPKTLSISHNIPQYFRFQFEESMSSVRILADSSNPNQICMTFSVQTLSCSAFDHPESVHYQGIYQTVTSSGALFVTKEEPRMNGFLIVLFVHPNNQECMRSDPFSLPFSSVFSSSPSSVEQTPSNSPTSFSVTLTAVADSKIDLDGNLQIKWALPILISFGIALATMALLNIRYASMRRYSAAIPRPRRPAGKELCKAIKRKLLANRFIEDFHISKFTNGSKFLCQVGHVGLIYAILACQFAFHYFLVEKRTGDMDLCYHNYRCAQPIGPFLDLNHLVSNLSYIIFGLLFYVISDAHERNLKDISIKCQTHIQIKFLNQQHLVIVTSTLEDRGLGIPPNFDMFKALGIALFWQGVLSACYHLCPNQTTFQFDTCFMYVIAMLPIVLIHHQRHPRCFNSNHTFGALGCILFLTFMGFLAVKVTSPDKVIIAAGFWVIQLGIDLLICFKYCFVGVLTDFRGPVIDGDIFKHIFIRDTWKMENFHSHRLIFPFISILITLLFGILWLIFKWNISEYLLYLLIMKLLWNVTHYFIMKVVHGEFTRESWILPSFCFLLSGVVAAFAMKYYLDVAAKWELTPSESRAVNHECLNIFGTTFPYDSHDAWHFLSAVSIFLAFIGLLTLDDDLILTPRADISVF